MNFGPTELIIILLIILLIFGGAKLPQLARSLGQAKHEFEKGASDPKSKDSEPADKKEEA
jgi:sec-independent protein translocase protein TatA